MKNKIIFILMLVLFVLKGNSQVNSETNLISLDTVFNNKTYTLNVGNQARVWSETQKGRGTLTLKSDSLGIHLFVLYHKRLEEFNGKKISRKLTDEEYRSKICTNIMEYYSHAEKNELETYQIHYDAQSHIMTEKIYFLTGNKHVLYTFKVFLEDGNMCFLVFNCAADESRFDWIDQFVATTMEFNKLSH